MSQDIEILHKDDLMTNERYVKLASLLVSEYHLQLMEQLKETKAYKQCLRNNCNSITRELKIVLREDLDLICGIDDKLVFNVQDSMEQIITLLASIRPEYIGVSVIMMRKLIEHPQETMEFFNLKMKQNVAA